MTTPGHDPALTQPAASHAGAQTPAPGREGRSLAIASLILAGVHLLFAPAMQFVIRGVAAAGHLPAISTVSLIGNVTGALVAVVGLILGIVALTRRGAPVLAGAAVGIHAAALISLVLIWMAQVLSTLAYSTF